MSRKREKKIKRLRKVALLPQILETYLVEFAFIILIAVVVILDMYSMFYSLATKKNGYL